MRVQYEQKDIQEIVNKVKDLDVPWRILNPIMVLLMTKGIEIENPHFGYNPTVERILAGGRVLDNGLCNEVTIQIPELVV